MSAIRICQGLVAAQKEYYSAQSKEYAQKIFSDEGKHNGLYWKAAAGEPQNPIGPAVAAAAAFRLLSQVLAELYFAFASRLKFVSHGWVLLEQYAIAARCQLVRGAAWNDSFDHTML